MLQTSASGEPARPRVSRASAAAFILLAPGVMMTPVWLNGGLGAGEDDVLYYYPSRLFFHESIARGEWPAIQPMTGLGRPFLADPQSAFWYPATWLFAVMPPTAAYPASLWLHYSLAMWGVYRWVRSRGGGRAAGLFGGLVFAFSGFMLAHRAHFAMQHAAAWTPWVLWRLQRFVEAGGGARLVWGAGAAAMQCFAGHVQVAAMTAVGGLVYVVLAGGAARGGLAERVALRWRRAAGCWLATWLLAGGLFAVQWLPTLAYVRECTRIRHDYWDFTQNSWHPASVVGLAMPMLMGQRVPNWFDVGWWGPSHQVEQFAYAGLLPLMLAALAMRAGGWTRPGRRGAIALAVFALLLALGKYGPVCPVLYLLPGSSLFRVPARAMVLFNLAVAVLAALSLHDLTAGHTPERVRVRWHAQQWARRTILPAVILVGVIVATVAGAALSLDPETKEAALRSIHPLRPAVWGPVLIGIASLAALRRMACGWQRVGLLWPAVAVTAVDLGVMGWSIDVPPEMTGPSAILNPPAREEWAQHIDDERRLWVVAETSGVYSEPVSKGAANTNVLIGRPALTDYGPLQPVLYYETFRFAPWGSPEDAERLLGDVELMRACNVGWVLVASPQFPPPAGGELVVRTSGGLRLYRLGGSRRYAWIEGEGSRVEVERVCNGEFRVRVAGVEPSGAERRLVVSHVALPGWRARRSDGTEIPIEVAHGALMAVRLAAPAAAAKGGHEISVTWTYETPGLRAGAVTSVFALLACGGMLSWGVVGTGRATRR